MNDITLEPNDVLNEAGEFADFDVFAGADVDGAGFVVVLHEKEAGVGQVVDVQEFAAGGACAPECDGGVTPEFGFVEFADERGEDVGALEVVVVVGAVEVGGHRGDVVATVLISIGIAQLDACDFGDGVGFVGGFEGAGEEVFFFEGLRGEFRVDAAGSEEHQLGDAVFFSGVDDVGLDHEVVVEEHAPMGVVGEDPSYFCGSEEDVVGFFVVEEVADGLLIAEVEVGGASCDEVGISFGFKFPEDGRADHAAVAGDIDFIGFLHDSF